MGWNVICFLSVSMQGCLIFLFVIMNTPYHPTQFAPIVLFVYNRPFETQRTLNALKLNTYAQQSDLYIYSENADLHADVQTVKDVFQVRKMISNVTGFKSVRVIEWERHMGLAHSIINGTSEVLQKHGRVIVLEDDLITSPNFLSYINQTLDYYEGNRQVMSVTGFSFKVNVPSDYEYDTYFTRRLCTYGWGTWLDRWETVDWEVKDYNSFKWNPIALFRFMRGGQDLPRMLSAYMKGKLRAWSIRFCYHQFKTNTYTVYPTQSKIDNIGYNAKGTNTTRRKRFDTVLFQPSDNHSFHLAKDVFLNRSINRSFLKKYTIVNRIIANYFDWANMETWRNIPKQIARWFSWVSSIFVSDIELRFPEAYSSSRLRVDAERI